MNSDDLARRLAELMKKGNPIEISGDSVLVDGVPLKDGSNPQIERVVRSRKTSPKQEFGKIKVLAYRTKFIPDVGIRTSVYVAGDRSGAIRVFSLPVGAILTYGKIHNLGTGNRWVIVLLYEFNGSYDTHLVMIESGRKQTVSPTPIVVQGGMHCGYGFFIDTVYDTPLLDETITPSSLSSTRSAAFTGTGYTATFSGEEHRGKTYTVSPRGGWTGVGAETGDYTYSGTASLEVPLNSPIPDNCVPTRYILFREDNRIILHDYENDFYTVVPPTVRNALLLEKQVDYFQTQPTVPLIRRYFKIKWNATFEQIVQWNVESDPSVGPDYIVSRYNAGLGEIPFNSSTITTDLQFNKEISAGGSQSYTLYRDQLTSKGRSWSFNETSRTLVNSGITTSTSAFNESFASQIVLAPNVPELVKPYTVVRSGTNGSSNTVRETYGTYIFAKKEGLYASEVTGSPVKRFYWKLDKDGNFSQVELGAVPQGVADIGSSGDLIQGTLYRLKQGVPSLTKPTLVEVSQLKLQSMQEKTLKYPVFPLTNANRYFYLDASFNPN